MVDSMLGEVQMTMTMDAEGVNRILQRVTDRISGESFYRFLDTQVADFFHNQIEMNFEGGGSAFGGRWQPLSSATQDIRSALGYGAATPINQRTGEMFKVLTEASDVTFAGNSAELNLPGKAGQAYPVREKIVTAQAGRSAEENPIWQFGETPARPIFGITEFNAERVLAALNDWIILDIASGGGDVGFSLF